MNAPTSGFGRALRMAGVFFSLMTSSQESRSHRMYELYERHKLPTEDSGYMNMGYWLEGCDSLDEAGQNLADLLAESAGMAVGDIVLDAGFGFGDQDFRWLASHRPKKIVGLNLTARHVEYAQARARQEGVSDRLEFRRHSATDLDYPDGTFDRVLAMESAFHFDTRWAFFAQAHRVLRSGGVLATADIIAITGQQASEGANSLSTMRAGPFPSKLPAANSCDAHEYEKRMKEAGFVDVSVRSIRDNVYSAWFDYMAARVRSAELAKKLGRTAVKLMAKEFSKGSALERELAIMDYVIAVGAKA